MSDHPPSFCLRSWVKWAFRAVALPSVLLVAGIACQSTSLNASGQAGPEEAKALYHSAWQLVYAEYVDPTFNGQDFQRWKNRYDTQIKTMDDATVAIRTMLGSLNDPYSRFLDPKSANEQNMSIDSRLFGVGIHLATDERHNLVVISTVDDSPAKKAGILSRDKIVRIDQTPTAALDLEAAVDKIRGPKGTPVALTIMRDKQKLVYHLIRDEIHLKSVFGEPVSPDIGYIRISSFISQDTAKEMLQALKLQQNKKALIVDLRGNNGGLLPNALEIADMFLKNGTIVSTVDRSQAHRTFDADAGSVYNGPMVVLIDQGSASASEILSGALKDNHRATLIGETTFGKGLVQRINYLPGGAELNLTVSKYLTPSGRDINKKGIDPNVTVAYTLADFEHHRDPQKQAAIQYVKTHWLNTKQPLNTLAQEH